jgi:hypothetical protein
MASSTPAAAVAEGAEAQQAVEAAVCFQNQDHVLAAAA